MSFIEKMKPADRAKKATEPPKSLLSRLKKGVVKKVAIGAALVTTAAAGWGQDLRKRLCRFRRYGRRYESAHQGDP